MMPLGEGQIRLGAKDPMAGAAQRRLMSLSGLPGGGGLVGGGGGAGQVLSGPESGAGVGAPGGMQGLPPELMEMLMQILGGGQPTGGMQ